MGCFSQKGLCYSFGILHGLLSNKNIMNPMKKIFGGFPLYPQVTLFWLENGKIWWNQLCRHACRKISASADGGWAEGPACTDLGARTPIGASGNLSSSIFEKIGWIKFLKKIKSCPWTQPRRKGGTGHLLGCMLESSRQKEETWTILQRMTCPKTLLENDIRSDK